MGTPLKATTAEIQMILDSARDPSACFEYTNPKLPKKSVRLSSENLARNFFDDYQEGDGEYILALATALTKINVSQLIEIAKALPDTNDEGNKFPHTLDQLRKSTGISKVTIHKTWRDHLENPDKKAHEYLFQSIGTKGRDILEEDLLTHMKERPEEEMPIQCWAKKLGVWDKIVQNYASNWRKDQRFQ